MLMYLVVSRDNPEDKPQIMSVAPQDGFVLVPADELGTEKPEGENAKDPLAFVCEDPALPQLFPRREWAQILADDVVKNGTEAFVMEVEVKL